MIDVVVIVGPPFVAVMLKCLFCWLCTEIAP